MQKKRYVIAGCGARGIFMFGQPLVKELSESAELVGLFDINPMRTQYASKLLGGVPAFASFEEMMAATNPDGVIVAGKDVTHAQYVIKALQAGKRAFSEKPLCVSPQQCREIIAAAKASKGTLLTTHNMRYGSACRTVRNILKSGRLGKVLFMQFDETLNRRHGADYFRRWHAVKANSGGLQIHKASHHFDMINWWAFSHPASVRAQGGLTFYGKNNSFRGERCLTCQHADRCEFHVELPKNQEYKDLYQDNEPGDGYHRDGCVWRQEIDIEDQLAVQIKYANGLDVAYTLNAYSPLESMRVVIEGTKGRLELSSISRGTGFIGKIDVPGVETITGEQVRLIIPGEGIQNVPLEYTDGGHGGADPLLHQDFFARDWDLPPNEMMAGLDDAIQAVLIGCAVNKSLETGQTVAVQELLNKD